MGKINTRNILASTAVIASVVLAVAGSAYMSEGISSTLAIAIFCIGLWSTGVIPEYLTALCFFLLATLFKLAGNQSIFSGFQSPTIWLIFGGLAIGSAIRHTGLGERLAFGLLRVFGARYPAVVTGMVIVGLALGFIMPSSVGRAVLLMPIAVALCDTLGFHSATRGRAGILLAAAFGSHVPTFAILPSNIPNMILAGAAEAQYRYAPSYMEYLILHFPVLGLLRSIILVVLILLLFRDPAESHEEIPPPNAWTRAELKMLAVLATCLVLWSTDSLHHVSPAWVSLAAGILCLWPGAGLTSPKAFSQDINFGSLFFVAAVLGLGALVSASQIGEAIVRMDWLRDLIPSTDEFQSFMVLSMLSSLVATVTTLPGVPAVMVPIAGELSRISGLPVSAVLMTQVAGFSTMLLPYQSPPLVVATQLGAIQARDAAKLSIAMFLVSVLAILPIDYAWWRLLGWL